MPVSHYETPAGARSGFPRMQTRPRSFQGAGRGRLPGSAAPALCRAAVLGNGPDRGERAAWSWPADRLSVRPRRQRRHTHAHTCTCTHAHTHRHTRSSRLRDPACRGHSAPPQRTVLMGPRLLGHRGTAYRKTGVSRSPRRRQHAAVRDSANNPVGRTRTCFSEQLSFGVKDIPPPDVLEIRFFIM